MIARNDTDQVELTSRFQPILDEHLESWTGKKRPARSSHVGMFIEEEGCAGMEQMKNCSVLAACRGQIVEEVGQFGFPTLSNSTRFG